MKILKIETINHRIFGNMVFDFTDQNGNSIDTIIIAGENGCGKTVLLDMLYAFSNFSYPEFKDEKRIYTIQITDEEYQILRNNPTSGSVFNFVSDNNIFEIIIDFKEQNSMNRFRMKTYSNLNGEKEERNLPGAVFTHGENRKILKSIYSDVEINYNPQQIKSTTALELDQDKRESTRSNNNIATEITQLLVDVQTLDALDFNDWAKNNVKGNIDPSQLDIRMKRFVNAFNLIFPNKRFKGIENKSGLKKVVFEEFGKEMPIEKLCSGEKQIVFRGGFILKDKNCKNSFVLIDEPEISLHPKWQLNILQFYKTLLANEKGEQTSQLFIATHSPFIIHNSNRNRDKVIILQKDKYGIISQSEKPVFFTWGQKELIKEAFNIDYNLFSEKAVIFVEGETDEKYFEKAKEVLGFEDIPFVFQWIGKINRNGNVEFTGDGALNHTKNFLHANPNILQTKVVLLYDSDTNKPEEINENLLVRTIPHQSNNHLFKKGIENLLVFNSTFNPAPFYKESRKIDDYGAESINRQLNKNKLCHWVCDELEIHEQKQILKNFELLIVNLIRDLSI